MNIILNDNSKLEKILKDKQDELYANRDKVRKELEDNGLDKSLTYNFISDIREYVLKHNDKMTYVRHFQKLCLMHLDKNFLADFLNPDYSIEGDKKSPLYGVPVSLKEALAVEGYDSTCGLIKNCLKPCKKDSVIVKVLKHVGAIPYITTSMAQGGLSVDSSNPVHGKQENPRFPGFLAGGSSGGEGIALSLCVSPIGVGTDLGGSIRFPAAFNGVMGLKPTYPRLSTRGHVSISEHLPLILRIVIGPMGRSVEDLADFMRAVLCDFLFTLDPEVVPLKFNEEWYSTKKLRVGYYVNFDEPSLPQTVPSVRRGVRLAVDNLRLLGHEVREFKIPDLYNGIRLALSCLFADGGKAMSIAYQNEILDESNKEMGDILKVSKCVRRLVGGATLKKFGDFIGSLNEEINGFTSYSKSSHACFLVENFKTKFLEAMEDLDVIICPLYPVPIPKKKTEPLLNNIGTIYALLYNILNFPAGVIPVGKTTQDDIKKAKEAKLPFEKSNDALNIAFHDTQDTVGQPLCVQVVGKPFREEYVLCAMKCLEMKSEYKLEMPEKLENSQAMPACGMPEKSLIVHEFYESQI